MELTEKKRAIILIIGVVLLVTIIKLLQNYDSTKNELKKKGYTKEEINIIIERLNEEEINKILEIDYNSKLVSILNEKYYIPDNLFEYINHTKNEDNLNNLISEVNVGANNDWYTKKKETNIDKETKMLVNKFNYLNTNYSPNDIVQIKNWYAYNGHKIKEEVNKQYVKMWEAANKEGLVLLVNSSFRTFDEQQKEYDKFGDDYASRPGFSEHQTGLALDIITYNIIGNEFENTNEFKWLQRNAHKFGFILRYPKNKENITGYKYESWHYRYLGVNLATKVYESNLTYDEYYAYYCEFKKEC